MISFIRSVFTAMLFLLVSWNTLAQSVPSSLFACLDGNGDLYGVTPTGKLGERCSANDLPVTLGSAGAVSASNGLVGNITNGVVDIGLAEGLAIPPSCPPGQIPISDGNGEWICTLPNIDRKNPNSKVWVLPHTEALGTQLDQVFVRVLNPSTAVARVNCFYFDNGGSLLLDAISISPGFTLGRGASDRCFIRADFAGEGWVLVTSDVPVLATATASGSSFRTTPGGPFSQGPPVTLSASWALQPYAIDCEDPAGVEFVCSFVSQ